MRQVLLALGVLVLGIREVSYWRVDPARDFDRSDPVLFASLEFLPVLVYSIVCIVQFYRIVNELPGVLALRRRLGTVRSRYDYLWIPAIVGIATSFTYGDVYGSASDKRYRLEVDYDYTMPGLIAFVLMMLAFKLRAAMREANRVLESGGVEGETPPTSRA